jgi:hypothetical protein
MIRITNVLLYSQKIGKTILHNQNCIIKKITFKFDTNQSKYFKPKIPI